MVNQVYDTNSGWITLLDGLQFKHESNESDDVLVCTRDGFVTPSSLYIPKPPQDILDLIVSTDNAQRGGFVYLHNGIGEFQQLSNLSPENLSVFNQTTAVPYMHVNEPYVFELSTRDGCVYNSNNQTIVITFSDDSGRTFTSGMVLITTLCTLYLEGSEDVTIYRYLNTTDMTYGNVTETNTFYFDYSNNASLANYPQPAYCQAQIIGNITTNRIDNWTIQYNLRYLRTAITDMYAIIRISVISLDFSPVS